MRTILFVVGGLNLLAFAASVYIGKPEYGSLLIGIGCML